MIIDICYSVWSQMVEWVSDFIEQFLGQWVFYGRNTSVVFIYFYNYNKISSQYYWNSPKQCNWNSPHTQYIDNTVSIHWLHVFLSWYRWLYWPYSCLQWSNSSHWLNNKVLYCTCKESWIYFMLKIIFLTDNLCQVHASPWHYHGYIWAMNEICR